jgi:co-chaperonin GroES (HSP10)
VPQIEVTFDIDANGILHVSAKDLGTGKEQKITITASSGLQRRSRKDARDAEAHAEEDRKQREEIEARNEADNAVYRSEKMLRITPTKSPATIRPDRRSHQGVKEALKGSDAAAIKRPAKNSTRSGNRFQPSSTKAASKKPGAPASPRRGAGTRTRKKSQNGEKRRRSHHRRGSGGRQEVVLPRAGPRRGVAGRFQIFPQRVRRDLIHNQSNEQTEKQVWQLTSNRSATGSWWNRRREGSEKGGIIIPDTAKEKPTEGIIRALGTGKTDDNGKKIPFEVKVGDRVLVSKYGGTEIKLDGKEYKFSTPTTFSASSNNSPNKLKKLWQQSNYLRRDGSSDAPPGRHKLSRAVTATLGAPKAATSCSTKNSVLPPSPKTASPWPRKSNWKIPTKTWALRWCAKSPAKPATPPAMAPPPPRSWPKPSSAKASST